MEKNLTKGEIFAHIRRLLKEIVRDYNAEFRFVLFTPSGKIVCDIEPPANKNSFLSFTDDPGMFEMDISAIFDEKEVFDVQFINARNVIIYRDNSDEELFRVPQMALFADQIIGFTLIKKQTLR